MNAQMKIAGNTINPDDTAELFAISYGQSVPAGIQLHDDK
jgi:hypothetical protein